MQWMDAVGVYSITKSTRICSDHFDVNDFYYKHFSSNGKRRLLSTAVPFCNKDVLREVTLNVTNVSNDVQFVQDSSPTACDNQDENPICLEEDENSIENLNPHPAESTSNKCALKRNRNPIEILKINDCKKIRFLDGNQSTQICKEDFKSHESWIRFLKYTIVKNRQLDAIRQKNKRTSKKMSNLNELIKNLKEENSTAAANYLESLPEPIKAIIHRIKDGRATEPFPLELKNFARSLHYHSPAAYEMVRKTFLKSLPCVETLNRWACSQKYKPGISQNIIEHVSKIVQTEKTKGKKLLFNLTFDEMGLKEWAFYCQRLKEWRGFVDFGGQLQDVDEKNERPKAKKALVFMIVCINGGFKTPVAYYLTKSLSGQDKCLLVRDLLIILHEKEIDIVNITFDGDESNIKTCKILGASFNYLDINNFKPYIVHPATNEIIYIFFDACHMLKLVRNYFALKGPLYYNNNNIIDWKYIKLLNNVQYDEELHCACKIRNRHVFFQNEKMKVYLAAQVLSNSAATALNFLEFKIKDSRFIDSSATANFCRVFNDIFDVLNAKNKFCKVPGRTAVTAENLSELNEFVNNFVSYIENLSVNVAVTAGAVKNKEKKNY